MRGKKTTPSGKAIGAYTIVDMDPDDDPKSFRNDEFWDVMTPARWALRAGSEALRGAYEAIVTLHRVQVHFARLLMGNRRRIERLEGYLEDIVELLPPSSRRRLDYDYQQPGM